MHLCHILPAVSSRKVGESKLFFAVRRVITLCCSHSSHVRNYVVINFGSSSIKLLQSVNYVFHESVSKVLRVCAGLFLTFSTISVGGMWESQSCTFATKAAKSVKSSF